MGLLSAFVVMEIFFTHALDIAARLQCCFKHLVEVIRKPTFAHTPRASAST